MPLIPRVGPGEVVPLRRVQPQDVGSGVGQNAFGQAADALSSVTAQLQTAEQTARVASGIAGVSAKFDELRVGLDQDPDHDSREEKFEAARAGVLKEFRDKIKGGAFQADFDARAFQIGERQKLAVREGVIRTRLDIARGDLLMGVDSLVDQASKTDSDVLKAGLLEQADQLMAKGVEKGAITASQLAELKIRHDSVLEQADERRVLAGIREAIRIDPARAVLDLQNPESPLAAGLDEFQRQVAIDQAITEHTQGLAADRAAATFAQTQQDRREREIGDEAQKIADELLVTGDVEGLKEHLAESRRYMTPEQRRFYLKRLEAGGGLEDHNAQTVPEVYSDLFSRAAAGEPITKDADTAYRRGQLTIEKRDSLIKASEERRFGAAEQYLAEKLRVGEAVENMTGRALSAEAGAAMLQWRQRNPDATDEEAMAKARDLGARYSLLNMDAVTATYPEPPFAVGQRDAYDIPATKDAINAAFKRKHGIPEGVPEALDVLASDPEYGEAMELVERWQKSQQDRAREQATQQAEKGAARGK